jgi:enoyl-CoA hydratase/carnithine racemase
MTESVTYEQDGSVVTLTLSEPDTRNAVAGYRRWAGRALQPNRPGYAGQLRDRHRRAGDSFSSGGNVKEMRDRTGLFGGTPAEIRRGYHHGLQKIPMAVYDLEVPGSRPSTTMPLGGSRSDPDVHMRIAADDARFAESFMRAGLLSGDAAPGSFPRGWIVQGI